MIKLREPGSYIFAAAVITVASIVSTGVAIWIANEVLAPYGPNWQGWVLNTVPAFMAGFFVVTTVSTLLRRYRSYTPTFVGHGQRAISLYFIGAAGAWIIIASRGNPDFWLYGQLILGPSVGAAGGIFADLCAIGISRRNSAAL